MLGWKDAFQEIIAERDKSNNIAKILWQSINALQRVMCSVKNKKAF